MFWVQNNSISKQTKLREVISQLPPLDAAWLTSYTHFFSFFISLHANWTVQPARIREDSLWDKSSLPPLNAGILK